MGKKTNNNAGKVDVSDVNVVQLLGTVVRANQYDKVCRFTLDCVTKTASGKDAHAFVPVVWFNGDQDETVDKGERVSVSGSIRSGSYTNKDGAKVYTTDIVADTVEIE